MSQTLRLVLHGILPRLHGFVDQVARTLLPNGDRVEILRVRTQISWRWKVCLKVAWLDSKERGWNSRRYGKIWGINNLGIWFWIVSRIDSVFLTWRRHKWFWFHQFRNYFNLVKHCCNFFRRVTKLGIRRTRRRRDYLLRRNWYAFEVDCRSSPWEYQAYACVYLCWVWWRNVPFRIGRMACWKNWRSGFAGDENFWEARAWIFWPLTRLCPHGVPLAHFAGPRPTAYDSRALFRPVNQWCDRFCTSLQEKHASTPQK